jgi:diguanylate cyclase (GGDEF)-like protein
MKLDHIYTPVGMLLTTLIVVGLTIVAGEVRSPPNWLETTISFLLCLLTLSMLFQLRMLPASKHTQQYLSLGFWFLYVANISDLLDGLVPLSNIWGTAFEEAPKLAAYAFILIGFNRWISYNRNLTAELRNSALTDELTGLANRRCYFDRLEKELDRAEEEQLPLSIVVLDIDHFKKLNDTYGHRLGDCALVKLAAVLKKELRATDLAARIGGEEFELLLPHTSLEDALRITKRLRQAIMEIDVSPADGMTASFGVTEYLPGTEKSTDLLRKHADRLLYRAKKAGRNAIVHGDESILSEEGGCPD